MIAAIVDLLFVSGDVVGTDGARQQLRHEQTGDILRFGGLGVFLTANLADTPPNYCIAPCCLFKS